MPPVVRILDELIQSITEVRHTIHRGESIGVLEILVLYGRDTTHVLELRVCPRHGAFYGRLVVMRRGHSIRAEDKLRLKSIPPHLPKNSQGHYEGRRHGQLPILLF